MVRISMSQEDRSRNERALIDACIYNIKSWARGNLSSQLDLQVIEDENTFGEELSEPLMRLYDRIMKLRYHGLKECMSDHCRTKGPVEGSYFLPILEFSGANSEANKDIDGLSKYCDNCSDILPMYGLIDGWELERYVQYARSIKEIYDKRSDPGRYQAVHSLNTEAFLGDKDKDRQEKLRFLENGVKRCHGKFCARRNELGVVEDIVDLKDFPKDSKSPDGLGSVCKECLRKKYKESDEYKKLEEMNAQEERLAEIRRIESDPDYRDPLVEACPDAFIKTYQCGKCFEYLTKDKFPNYKVKMSSRGYKVCKKCRTASARRLNLGVGDNGDVEPKFYAKGDNVNRKNIFHFMMSNDTVKKFFNRYTIDVNRGIIVHRQAERVGAHLRAPGDEAYSMSTNKEKTITIEKGAKPIMAKLVLSVLYDLTDPKGTVVLRNRDSLDLRPCNVAQWHALDPDSPVDRTVDPKKPSLKVINESRNMNKWIVDGARGHVTCCHDGRWIRSCSLDSPEDSYSVKLPEYKGFDGLMGALDGFRRNDVDTMKYIYECDRSYLEHVHGSCMMLHSTDERPLYSLKGKDVNSTLSGRLYKQIVEAVELAMVK